eukprot:767474-Hanusia_phi.AAC.1
MSFKIFSITNVSLRFGFGFYQYKLRTLGGRGHYQFAWSSVGADPYYALDAREDDICAGKLPPCLTRRIATMKDVVPTSNVASQNLSSSLSSSVARGFELLRLLSSMPVGSGAQVEEEDGRGRWRQQAGEGEFCLLTLVQRIEEMKDENLDDFRRRIIDVLVEMFDGTGGEGFNQTCSSSSSSSSSLCSLRMGWEEISRLLVEEDRLCGGKECNEKWADDDDDDVDDDDNDDDDDDGDDEDGYGDDDDDDDNDVGDDEDGDDGDGEGYGDDDDDHAGGGDDDDYLSCL